MKEYVLQTGQDLRAASRVSSFLEIKIDLPTDDLIRVIILKIFSDRQIDLGNRNLEFIIKK